MAFIPKPESNEKSELYPYILKHLEETLSQETDKVANMANTAALLGYLLNDINWAGFYLYTGEELLLGPFWGKPAVTRIEMGKGVCGTTAANKTTTVVEDVHQFPGHIACDLFSNSEIVVPIIQDGNLKGVLDIDSPEIGRFDEIDQKYLEAFVELFNKHVKL